MIDNYIQNIFAERIGGKSFGKSTKIYKFQKIKESKQEALKIHPNLELLDFGVGEPDEMAPTLIREEMKKQIDVWDNRGYADNGIDEFKQAASRFMKNFYEVDLNPENEINHTIGIKPGLAIMPLCFINPGDVSLMTVPGYPVMGDYTRFLGGETYDMPLLKENNFLPNIDDIPNNILKKAKLMYLNYPNNPTGAIATVDFYKKVINFAKKNNIRVVQDAPYAALVYNSKPLSFLSVEGAKEVGVEFHSMSKSFNMTGWRLGYIAGNELIVKAFSKVKDYTDSGQFKAIQLASAKALDNSLLINDITNKYNRRLKGMVEILNQKGFDASMPGGTFYLYVQIPKSVKGGKKFNNAEEFSDFLIREKLISTVPWDEAGSFFRMSATYVAKNEEDEERVLKEFKRRLEDIDFEF